jgi:hypothetical protein
MRYIEGSILRHFCSSLDDLDYLAQGWLIAFDRELARCP